MMGCAQGRGRVCCQSKNTNLSEVPTEMCTPRVPDTDMYIMEKEPLTKKQKDLLRGSWNIISKNVESTGVDMFVKLFEDNPHLIEVFGFYKRWEDDSRVGSVAGIGNSVRWKKHINIVMGVLSFAIQHIDEYDKLKMALHKLAIMHAGFGIKSTDFVLLKEPFMYAVMKTLGGRDVYTENYYIVYNTTIDFLLGTLKNELEDTGV